MNQQNYISPGVIVFSKWSRKDYAVFASLGKQIKIGVLKAEICQKALLKGFVDLGQIVKIKEDIDEDKSTLDSTIHDSLQLFLSSLGLSVLCPYIFVSLTISEEKRSLRTIFFNEYKVCFLPNVKTGFFYATIFKNTYIKH